MSALWVVISHVGEPPLLQGIDKSTPIGWLVNGLYGNLINGPAAVIVFFVISGFCIHYPNSDSMRLRSLSGYFARRYIRIGIPLASAIAIAPLLHVQLQLFEKTILWSLLAELIYYAMYPFFLWLRRRGFTWLTQVGMAFILSLAVAATDPGAGNYPSYGGLNWLLGLPCWLIGCYVAEASRTKNVHVTQIDVRIFRILVLGVSVICSILRFHSPAGYPWTLNFFAILAGLWLLREIEHYKSTEPLRTIEALGSISYSLYLTHPLAIAALSLFSLPNLGYIPNWSLKMLLIIVAAAIFFVIIEYPAHRLARIVGTALSRKFANAMSK